MKYYLTQVRDDSESAVTWTFLLSCYISQMVIIVFVVREDDLTAHGDDFETIMHMLGVPEY